MQVINFGNELQTMTSREIAELTGKEHRNVLADIRKMLLELHGEGGLLNFQHTHRNEQNGQYYPILAQPVLRLSTRTPSTPLSSTAVGWRFTTPSPMRWVGCNRRGC